MFIKQIDYKSTKESILGTSSREVGKQGAAEDDGGGSSLLTSSGGIICKSHKILIFLLARQWS